MRISVFCTPFSILVAGSVAFGACPPVNPTASPFAAIERYTRDSGSPLNQEQAVKLIADLLKKGELSPVDVRPSYGAAPLRVKFSFIVQPEETPRRIEFDAEGNGRFKGIESESEMFSRHEHTYEKPGLYQFTVRVSGSSGQARIYRIPIRVVTSKDLDAELQTRWNDLRTALSRGSVAEALECILTPSRDRYKELFVSLGPRVSEFGTDMPQIQSVYIESEYAEYRLRRQEQVGGSTQTISYFVYFAADVDGIWRIQSF
jgi:hypothetical protein